MSQPQRATEARDATPPTWHLPHPRHISPRRRDGRRDGPAEQSHHLLRADALRISIVWTRISHGLCGRGAAVSGGGGRGGSSSSRKPRQKYKATLAELQSQLQKRSLRIPTYRTYQDMTS